MLRPNVLTIAGFDPSSGAGLSADLKTIEQMGGYGLGICTGLTLQSEREFVRMEWRPLEKILDEVSFMLRSYRVSVIKTGILPSTEVLLNLLEHIHTIDSKIKVVVDPVLTSTTGHQFTDISFADNNLLRHIHLITPNLQEWKAISLNGQFSINDFAKYTSLLLKSVDPINKPGVDHLYFENHLIELKPTHDAPFPKHGSGCVLASAIATSLALGNSIETSCRLGKNYVTQFLNSNTFKLGYHAA